MSESCSVSGQCFLDQVRYEKIAKELSKKGSKMTAEQYRAKMKKIRIQKVKDKHSQTGESRSTCKYFDAMDNVLGHRPTTRPSIVLDASDQFHDAEQKEPQEEEDEEDGGAVDQSSTSTVPDNSDEHPAQTPEASATSIKGKKRSCTKDKKIETIMTKVVKQVVDAQNASSKMFLDLEEKRMKFEAEQRRGSVSFSCK